METFFSWSTDNRFALFSFPHLSALFTLGVMMLLIFCFRSDLKEKRANLAMRLMIATALLLSEGSFHLWFIYYSEWSITTTLPLQLSSISLLLSVALLITKQRRLFEITYFVGTSSALLAMITPDLGFYSYPHFRFFHFFVAHGGIVLTSWLFIAVNKYIPSYRSIWTAFTTLNLYVAVLFAINLSIGSNYMFLINKPHSHTILDYLGPWPFYLLSLEGITIIAFHLLYLPFYILKSYSFNRTTNRKSTI
ncbi:TIGR02206 family membrane protein [Anaerobacillus sp. 1_MG-2023]|uniref:YwaF family protein n=1 Tax=Anaerobacillus sp. 1_MG-2023 TaxID=3062655 RepID=UPI0026E4177A|nr:TIGR02206 family membrane protein [Anaerobacillus sp. 1_MG-2023]MDO6657119.1 TIGR02206 family membrane protein [Anaerobacillus sp. 1_MG-2023]